MTATDMSTSDPSPEAPHTPAAEPLRRETFQGGTTGARAVELKVTVAAEHEMKAVRLLELDRSNAESREIYFFDTPQLACYKQNVVLRARVIQDGADNSTVKIRPVDPHRIGPLWKRLEGFKLEADVTGDKIVRSASLTHPQKRGAIRDVATGERSLKKLFSSNQERFLEVNALPSVPFDALRTLGPVAVLRWKSRYDGLPGELTAEEWHLPDGTDLLELSIKVGQEDALRSRARFVGFLDRSGIDHTGVQEAKTRIALEFFARQLATQR